VAIGHYSGQWGGTKRCFAVLGAEESARDGQDSGRGARGGAAPQFGRGAGDRAGGWSKVKPRSGEGAGAVAYGDRSRSTANPASRSGGVRAHGAQGGAVEVGSPRWARIAAVRVGGPGLASHPAIASLGTRPTLDGTVPLLEPHLSDFDDELYGRTLDVDFNARLRDEQRFDSLEALVEQMHRDAAEARKRLGI
jgi:Riboflavin kinase